MLVHRCDNCNKIVKVEGLILGHSFIRLELCKTCAKPVLRLINEQQLLTPELLKKLQPTT